MNHVNTILKQKNLKNTKLYMSAIKGQFGTQMLLFENMAINMNWKTPREHDDGLQRKR